MTPLSCSPPNKRLELFVTKDANRETVSKLESKEVEIISDIYREEIHGELVSSMTRFDIFLLIIARCWSSTRTFAMFPLANYCHSNKGTNKTICSYIFYKWKLPIDFHIPSPNILSELSNKIKLSSMMTKKIMIEESKNDRCNVIIRL